MGVLRWRAPLLPPLLLAWCCEGRPGRLAARPSCIRASRDLCLLPHTAPCSGAQVAVDVADALAYCEHGPRGI